MAFGHGKYFEEGPMGDTTAHIELCRAQIKLSGGCTDFYAMGWAQARSRLTTADR
jgi:hypothetical protein